jgi:hypothetical protein
MHTILTPAGSRGFKFDFYHHDHWAQNTKQYLHNMYTKFIQHRLCLEVTTLILITITIGHTTQQNMYTCTQIASHCKQ